MASNEDFRTILDTHLRAIRKLLESRMPRTYDDLEYSVLELGELADLAEDQELENINP